VGSTTQSQQPQSGRFWATQPVHGGAFITADDRQRLEAVIRGIRSGFCLADQSPLSELVEAAEDHLFNILRIKEHVLNSVLASSI